jgi:hypothetical protein
MFTQSEQEEILKLVLIYKERFSDVQRIGNEIKQAEAEVKYLISEIETIKSSEELLYQKLSEKYSLDIVTIQNQVAQTVLQYK